MYCRQCGAELRPGYVYCGSCGASTGESAPGGAAPGGAAPAPGGYIDRPVGGVTSYRYAGFWRRVGAYWLDFLIVALLSVIPSIVFGILLYTVVDGAQDPAFTSIQQQERDDNNALGAAFGAIGPWFVIYFAYNIIATALGGGWGKRAFGIRIYKDGTREAPGYGKAFLRVFFPVILGVVPLIGSLLQLIDHLWMIPDADKQTWHDKVAATVVAHG